jgi:hypothetical protein
MKRICLVFCLLFIFSKSFSQDFIQFKISKPQAVFGFMEAATHWHSSSSTLQEFINKNTKGDSTFKKLLADFQAIELDYSYKRDKFPASRRQYRSTYDLIKIALVNSNDFEEFRSRSMGILPIEHQEKLIQVLKDAEKYFDRLIWDKYQESFSKNIAGMAAYQKTASDIFARFNHFYNSTWPSSTPFIVAMYPIPGKKGTTTATPHANSLILGVLADTTRHDVMMGVVLHEICHVLYDEQSASFQHTVSQYFKNNPSKYTAHAYTFFDEGLATALGNGWAYKQINGKLDTKEWYNNEYINGFAKALYPKVEEYLENKKQIDQAFVDAAIAIFESTFPKSPGDYGILINKVNIYNDAATDLEREQIFNKINATFRLSNSNFSSPILDPLSLADISESKNTQLIIINSNHEKNWKALAKIFPNVKSYAKKNYSKPLLLSFYDEKSRPVIILNAHGEAELDSLLLKMKALKYFDLGKMEQ